MRIDGQGSNWIRRSTRLAIYDRDGFRCVYCCAKVRPGRGTKGVWAAHLDHVLASELGGSSRPDNLVTACRICNDAKAALPLSAFLGKLSARGVNVATLATRIQTALRTPINRANGRALAAAGK